MRVFADLHIHGRFSRATSERMYLGEIARYASMKGLNVVGTGDFTHPGWLKEIRETLTVDGDSGLYRVSEASSSDIRFILTTEVCTVFQVAGQLKKVHHVILAPNLDAVNQINRALEKHGDLSSDGRPILSMTASQLVEIIMKVSEENVIFPAHAWTPWFGIFGAFSGFDSIEQCYREMATRIHVLETGLSSDPPMNWRLSKLDKLTLVSNSDCHSFWPWRIGREANVFDLTKVTYRQITDAINTGDPSHFKFTIETDPAYGKYHWTGHRNCNVSLSPKEAKKLGNVCPVCRKKLTEGVEQRVEALADRPEGYVPAGKPGYRRLLPLSEIIATVLNVDQPSTQSVWKIYNDLIARFGNEYAVLLDSCEEELRETVLPEVATAILKVREGTVTVVPGFDGVYGKLVLGDTASAAVTRELRNRRGVHQLNLGDFW